MGTSAFAYHVRDRTQAQCLEALAAAKSPHAWVSDPINGWVTILNDDGQSFRDHAFEQSACKVSKSLKADLIITCVYDDDISQYVAIRAGKVIDRFSTPGNSFEIFSWVAGKKFPGKPKLLTETFPWFDGEKKLREAFKKICTVEASRLRVIAQAFGIFEHRVLTTMGSLQSTLAHPEFRKALRHDGFVEFPP